MVLDDYMDDGEHNRKVAQPTLRRILQVIASKKATYPSEIAKETRVDMETINQTIYDLKKAGIIEKLNPKMVNSDQRLLDRRSEMWAQGKTGIKSNNGQINKMNWFGLNSSLDWCLKVSDKDKYVDEYHTDIEDENPDFESSALSYADKKIAEVAK